MVLCIIAMVVFGFLGIFSLSYRKMALESFNCVFRMATLRPCQSDFDQKMKSKLLGKLMRFPKTANFTNKYFKTISVIFVILFFASLGYSGYAVYNLASYGTCTPENPENCIFTPLLNKSTNPHAIECAISGSFVEFYGAECPHCLKMIPILQKVEQDTGIIFQKLEVWHNDTNQKTMLMHAEDIQKACGILGVPAFYAPNTGNALCGELTEKQLKDFIIANG